MGHKIRRARVRMALTLEELAGKAKISKAYLSLIENGRVANPPSDEKLRRIEQALGMAANELIGQAQLQRTPSDVRTILERLVRQGGRKGLDEAALGPSSSDKSKPLDLDAAYLSGVLQELADRASSNVDPVKPATVAGRATPVVNKVSAGYPRDFTDMSYPPRVADAYITAPGVDDPDAFAARVSGDSMSPKYSEGDIVIFSPLAVWKDGSDCFVRLEEGQTTFKRVFIEQGQDGKQSLRLEPRNPRYQPRVVPREQVEGVYKAVFVYRAVGD